MPVKLRLTRMGKKKQPFYRIVAADSRTRRDGKYLEKIGHYNPLTDPADIVIDEERALYWLKNGAIPTDTVRSLFSKKGIMLKWHFMRAGYDQARLDEEFKKWELLQLEKRKRAEALAAQRSKKQETKPAESEPISPAAAPTGSEPQPHPSEAPVANTEQGTEQQLAESPRQEPAVAQQQDQPQPEPVANAEPTTPN